MTKNYPVLNLSQGKRRIIKKKSQHFDGDCRHFTSEMENPFPVRLPLLRINPKDGLSYAKQLWKDVYRSQMRDWFPLNVMVDDSFLLYWKQRHISVIDAYF